MKELSIFTPTIFDVDKVWKRLWDDDDFFSPSIRSKGYDIEEYEDRFEIQMDAPGIPRDKIQIDLKENILTVFWSIEREEKEEKPKSKYHTRSFGKTRKSFSVPNVDTEKVEANLENGVLKLVLPKTEKEKPKKIEIK